MDRWQGSFIKADYPSIAIEIDQVRWNLHNHVRGQRVFSNTEPSQVQNIFPMSSQCDQQRDSSKQDTGAWLKTDDKMKKKLVKMLAFR